MSQPGIPPNRIALTLVALLAVVGALLMARPRRAGGAAGGCKANGAFCKTNESCCTGVCTANACSPRFVDNGDGTVTDHQTGLQWEKKDNTFLGPHCVRDMFSWNSSEGTTTPNGTAFIGFLSTLNDCTSTDGTAMTNAGFAGHCDWRLPTIQELKTIVDLSAPGCGSGSPCIDPIFGPTQANFGYWSSTSGAGDPFVVWLVHFFDGRAFADYKTPPSFYYVRAVRGGS